ncbi:MAG TPA: SMC-Scp complex subunit ScpB [Candidatus Excrementavichristensenella intestinipullorum]|nr:SMC-Scp complex subunit ScpB [Candidatus Excrementavichristensenella intestinipullorum]
MIFCGAWRGGFDRPVPGRYNGEKEANGLDAQTTRGIVEAILYVAGEPVPLEDLAHALDMTRSEMEEVLSDLRDTCELEKRGLRLNRYGDGVQLSIRAEYAPYVERLLQPVQQQSLSQAAMETLSVIAYRQPVTKADIEKVRGVKCDYSVQSLLNKGLIQEQGRRETLGRPILYGTTDAFLRHFGIESLDQLPPQEEGPLEELGV